jgi:hypothetical protein
MDLKGVSLLICLAASLSGTRAAAAEVRDFPGLNLDKLTWGMSEAAVHATYAFVGRDAPRLREGEILVDIGGTASLDTNNVRIAGCIYNLRFYAPSTDGLVRVTAALKPDQSTVQCRGKALSLLTPELGVPEDRSSDNLEQFWKTARTMVILDAIDRNRPDHSQLVLTYVQAYNGPPPSGPLHE